MVQIDADGKGLYGLCVFNSQGYSDNEINKIFNAFGEVVHVNRTREGLLFIRYANQDEAVTCYESMQNHSKLNVKPAKKKADSKPDQQSRRKEGGYNNAVKDNTPLRQMPELKIDVPTVSSEDVEDKVKCHQVVMGHLHPYMRQSDVYHICKASNVYPVHINMRSFTRKSYPPMHYAIVYVKSDAEVLTLVKGVNLIKVNGFRLVVAPYEKLLDEVPASS